MKFVSPLFPAIVATLPTASSTLNGAVVSKSGTGAGLYYCDGTQWILLSVAVEPISAGGTGATTVAGAQTNLQVDPAGTAAAMAIALG